MICGAFSIILLIRSIVSPPEVIVGRTSDDLKAFLCKTDWWDYIFTSMEATFLAWGIRLCIMVRKAPSEFNESRFISMAIYNEFLLSGFLNVSMFFLQSPANPDLLYIIFFGHSQLTVSFLLGLIFGSKIYIVLRSGKSQENTIGLGAKSSATKYNVRLHGRKFVHPSTATSSVAQLTDVKMTDQEALEEIRQITIQLQRVQKLSPPRGLAALAISNLLESLSLTIQPFGFNEQSESLLTLSYVYSCEKERETRNQVDKAVNTVISGNESNIFSDKMKTFDLQSESNRVTTNLIDETIEKRPKSSIPDLYLESMCENSKNYCNSKSHIRNTDNRCTEDNLMQQEHCAKNSFVLSINDTDFTRNSYKYYEKFANKDADSKQTTSNAIYIEKDTIKNINEEISVEESVITTNVCPNEDLCQQGKATLDLNDHSKYTKEVSV